MAAARKDRGEIVKLLVDRKASLEMRMIVSEYFTPALH